MFALLIISCFVAVLFATAPLRSTTLSGWGTLTLSASVATALAAALTLYGCGPGPDLERETEPCSTGEGQDESTDAPACDCEIEYLNPSLAQCICGGVQSDPENCPECQLLPCVEPER